MGKRNLAQNCVLYEVIPNQPVACMWTAWNSQTQKRETTLKIKRVCMGKRNLSRITAVSSGSFSINALRACIYSAVIFVWYENGELSRVFSCFVRFLVKKNWHKLRKVYSIWQAATVRSINHNVGTLKLFKILAPGARHGIVKWQPLLEPVSAAAAACNCKRL